jgi:hypothetical protein
MNAVVWVGGGPVGMDVGGRSAYAEQGQKYVCLAGYKPSIALPTARTANRASRSRSSAPVTFM